MKQAILVLIFVFLAYADVSAQWVQCNGVQRTDITSLGSDGRNLFACDFYSGKVMAIPILRE